ncbi:ABC transporter permease [Actinomadura soli]|uniref:ABC transporter permease n=1 Tax=Actinomadura soli TaxID=2508997 RepID=UPI00197AA847|nr:ABC transporter permease [Actinomadura soli]
MGSLVLLGLLLASLFAPLPHDPVRPDALSVLRPPSWDHIFGTDRDGLDVFSRTIASASRDVPLALGGALVSLLIGAPIGLLVSFPTRLADWVMRALDLFQAFPLVILAVALVTLTGNDLQNVVIAIIIINAPRMIRLVRTEALVLRSRRFVEAAHAIGASRSRVLFRHILPNVTEIMIAQTALAAAQAIVVVAALSFLGVGVSPPDPTWGLMIQSGSQQISTGQWWVVLFPGLAVVVAVSAFNAIGRGLQEAQR